MKRTLGETLFTEEMHQIRGGHDLPALPLERSEAQADAVEIRTVGERRHRSCIGGSYLVLCSPPANRFVEKMNFVCSLVVEYG